MKSSLVLITGIFIICIVFYNPLEAQAAMQESTKEMEIGDKDMNQDSSSLIARALEIIDAQLDIGPNLTIRSTGSEGRVMEAALLLKQAHELDPHNAYLHYAYIASLRLASQFKSSEEELHKLVLSHPDFALPKFSLTAWEGNEGIAPAMFRYPVWTPTTKEMPPLYVEKVKTFILFPAREGIYPRAVLFERDNEGWWTPEKLKDIKIELAIVVVPGKPNVAGIYQGSSGPGLEKTDIQENLMVLDVPKDFHDLVAWEYICEADFVDVVIIDRNNSIILNQRVNLSSEAKSKLKEVREILLTTPGKKISDSEFLRVLREYQDTVNLDDIEEKYFKK